jgi:hypothetical protein
MARTSAAWLFCVPCGADQCQKPVCVSASRDQSLEAIASATQSKGWHHVESDRVARGSIPARRANYSSLAPGAFCRQTPKVEARCANRARRDLCGGRSAMSVPTAIVKSAVAMGARHPLVRHCFWDEFSDSFGGGKRASTALPPVVQKRVVFWRKQNRPKANDFQPLN